MMGRDITAILVIGLITGLGIVFGDNGKEISIAAVSGLIGYLSKTPKTTVEKELS